MKLINLRDLDGIIENYAVLAGFFDGPLLNDCVGVLKSIRKELDPQDIIGVLVFLLSDTSQYINGQNMIIDDGFSI